MDVRMFTVGPGAGELLPVPARRLRPRADRRSGRRGRRSCSARSTSSGVSSTAILLTHTHFDHIGAVAPVAKATGRRGLGAGDREARARRHHELRALARLRAVRELRGRAHARRAASGSSSRASRSTCIFTPGHSPGHVTFSIPDEQAVFSGDVLFQGSVGRTDLPGGDWATLLESIRMLVDSLPGRDDGLPGAHGHHHAGRRAREQPVPGRAGPLAMAAKLQAPRGTFDVLPADGRAGAGLARRVRATCSAAPATSRSRRPAFEDTELFARGVGESTDIVQKEMFTFEDKGGRSLTLRPEGTARDLPRVRGARHAQAPAAGEALVLGPVLPPRGAAGGPLPAVHADGRRGARLRRPVARRRADRCCSRELLEPVGARGVAAAAVEPRHAGDARGLLDELRRATCASTRPSSPTRCATGSTINPLRAFDADHAGTRAVMEDAPRLLDRLAPDDAEHFAEVRALLDEPGSPTRWTRRWCAGSTTTRARCSSSSRARSARRAALGGGGRYDRLVEQLGGRRRRASAGRRASSGSCSRPASSRTTPGPAASSSRSPRRTRSAPHSRSCGGCASAGLRVELEQAGRSLKGQLKQADRIGARATVIVGRRDRGQGHGHAASRRRRPGADEALG